MRPVTGEVRRTGPAMPATLEWRAPEARHRPQVDRIVRETGLFRPDEIDVALEVFDAFCEAPGDDYRAQAAFTDADELAGFAFYGPTPCTVDTWDVYWIVVRPRAQGVGIGRNLLRRVEDDMRSAGARLSIIETSARDDYAGTREFYLRAGYREVARIPDFYDVGDHRVTYAKSFV